MVRVLSVDPVRPEPGVVAEAARILAAGGLVAFPTETVYGLGARAFDEQALARVFAAKGRPVHHPLIAHVEDERAARDLSRFWSIGARLLARGVWPGALTLVVDRASSVPAALSGGGDSVAVRVPDHPVAQHLIAALGAPIAAPSANRYQGLSPTTAAHVVEQLGDRVDLVLDGGPCRAGIESTVVDVRTEPIRVLRPGAVALSALRALVPSVVFHAERLPSAEARPSPGMAERHYAPRAKLMLAETPQDVHRCAAEQQSLGHRVAVVVYEAAWAVAVESADVRVLASEATLYGRDLFATLHELDAAGCDVVIAQRVPSDDAWWAIADRLARGAATGD